MDEVEELIEQRVRELLADAYEAHGRKMTAARLRGGSVHEDMLVALDALTKALTVSPEKLALATEAIRKPGKYCDFRSDPNEWRARAAAIALGLRCE